jgi:hypothetical protein
MARTPWPTGGDLRRDCGAAIEGFVSAILSNKEVILVTRKDGKIVDAFVSDNLPLSLEYLKDEELEPALLGRQPSRIEHSAPSSPLTYERCLWILHSKGLPAITP